MEKVLVVLGFFIPIVSGFYIMKKVDVFRKEESRRKGLPMDEED